MINIVYLENGLTPQLRKEIAVETTTIRDVAPDWSIPYIAFLDGKPILRKDWDDVLESEHCLAFIEAKAIPQDGGDLGGLLRTGLMIAAVVYAPYIANWAAGGFTTAAWQGAVAGTFAATTAGAFATAGVMLAGMTLINAVLPVKPLSSQQQAELAAPSPTYNLQAQGNAARIGAAIPEHFGRLRAYPDFASMPYTEYINNEQYLYQLLCVGRGEYLIEDIKLEDTPIQNFNDVETWQIGPNEPFTEFPTNVTTSMEVSGQDLESFSAAYTTTSGVITVTLKDHKFSYSTKFVVRFGTDTLRREVGIAPGSIHPDTVNVGTFNLNTVDGDGNAVTASAPGTLILSPIVGYYLLNQPQTKITQVKFDIVAPRGLYSMDDAGNLNKVTVYPVVEIREVDDNGNFKAGSIWRTPSADLKVDLGWEDYTDIETTNYYKAPPADTSTEKYRVMAWYQGALSVENSSIYNSPYLTYKTDGYQVSGPLNVFLGYDDSIGNPAIYGEPPGTTYTIQKSIARIFNATFKEGATTTPQRWSLKYNVSTGRYACRAYRGGLEAASTSNRVADTITWAGLSGYHDDNAIDVDPLLVINEGGVSKIVLKIPTHNKSVGERIKLRINRIIEGFDGGPAFTSPVLDSFNVIEVVDANTIKIQNPFPGTSIQNIEYFRDYGDVTLLAIKMRATSGLSMQASRKINVLATRKLQELEWSPSLNKTVLGANKVPTRRVDSAIAYAAKQIGLPETQIDYNSLRLIGSNRADEKEYFDGRFDNFVSFWEAVTKIALVVRSKPFLQAGILKIIRDEAATIPVAMFSQRNIVKNSLTIDYLLPTAESAQKVAVKYYDSITWQPATVYAYLGTTDPSTQPAVIDMFGITDRSHAYREGLYQVAANKYRRKIIKFRTEMEGFIPTFGDLIIIQHDLPAWGQGGEILAWDAGTRTATLSEEPEWTDGENHYIAFRAKIGDLQGDRAYLVTKHPTNPKQVVVDSSYTYTPYTGLDMERTFYTFGPGEAWRQPAKVLSVKPSGITQVEIECIAEDPSVHNAESYSNPVPPVKYGNLIIRTGLPRILTVKVDRIYDQPTKLNITWTSDGSAEYFLVSQQDSYGEWQLLGEYKENSAIINIIGNPGLKVRVAGVNRVGIGTWKEGSLPGILTLDVTGFKTLNVKRIRKQLEAIPLLDDLPSSFKEFEVRAFQDPGEGDFWESTDPMIQKIRTINKASFDMTTFGPPRLSPNGIKYRVACRLVDTAGNYGDTSLLGEYLLKNLI